MHTIFICYRREDAEGQAGRLFDDLVRHFGQDSVFMDVASIEPGRDFRQAIEDQVASCSVVLAVIGRDWLCSKSESGERRLDNPMDFVRLEIASALRRNVQIVPVVVRGASMPRAEQLPADLAPLAYRSAVELTHTRWDSDVQILIEALQRHVPPTQIHATEEPAVVTSHSARRLAGIAALVLSGLALLAGGLCSANTTSGSFSVRSSGVRLWFG